jgi:hypothetical protein
MSYILYALALAPLTQAQETRGRGRGRRRGTGIRNMELPESRPVIGIKAANAARPIGNKTRKKG